MAGKNATPEDFVHETAATSPFPDLASAAGDVPAPPEQDPQPTHSQGEDPFWTAVWGDLERIACGFCAWDSVALERVDDFWDHFRTKHALKLTLPYKRVFNEHGEVIK